MPARQAQIAAETDVLVVGGGPSGMGAALGAAWAGAEVVLAERYGFLGGNATAALVMPLMSFHTQRESKPHTPPFTKGEKSPHTPLSQRGEGGSGHRNIMPSDHGPGDPVVAGALRVFLERLVQAGGAIAPSEDTGFVVPFDPEAFKLAALDILDEAGVRLLFHAFASGIIGDGKVEGVVFETKSGPLVIKAKTVVDCTGDGDIAVQSGAPFQIGRDSDALVQPMTLMFRMADFDREAFQAYVDTHPDQWRGVHGLWDLVRQATDAGEIELPREDILFFGTPHDHEVSVNNTRVTRVLGTDVWDLSYAEWTSRQQMREIVSFLRKYVPGFARAYVVQSGVNVGVRETRRIIGEYSLTSDDVLAARKFPDAIARASYPVDIHNPKGKGTVLKRLPPGEAYDIPLRCLIPQKVDGVITAGRCISGSHEALSSYRVMPIAMATGQAAGVCAALAARARQAPRDVPAPQVQRELLRQGANLRNLQGV